MDGRRMSDVREEIGIQFSLTGRLVSRTMLAGHLVQTDGRQPKQAEVVKQ